ncbi:hypothetical protein Tco_1521496, partial [Tanacetum coccineum]
FWNTASSQTVNDERQIHATIDSKAVVVTEALIRSSLGRFEITTPEGVDLNQERWNLKSWDLYENCGAHTLILEDGTEIHMLAERKYPLTKETLERMLSLRLVAGTASEDAYALLRFIQKQIDKYRSHDGGEKDL